MPVLVSWEIDDEDVQRALAAGAKQVSDTDPLMADIGGHLELTTQERWEAQVDPSGRRWAPNSPATLTWGTKRGSITKRGRKGSGTRNFKAGFAKHVTNKRILVKRGYLERSIRHQLIDGGVEVGTDRVYAAAQQFGLGARSSARTHRTFGAIPPRPFLGISDTDLTYIRAAQFDFYRRALGLSE